MVNDQQDTVRYVNSYMSQIIGLPVDNIVGTNTLIESEKFPDRQIDKFVFFYTKAKETLEPVFYEDIPVVSSAGMEIVITGWIIPMLKNNQFDGMIITVRDMTRLQRLNQSLMATLEYAPHPVGLALQDHKKGPVASFHMNKLALKLFNIEQYDLTRDIKLSMQKSAEMLENGDEWLAQTARNFKGTEQATMEIIFKDGRRFTWDSRALRDADGRYCGRYVTIKEIKRDRRRGDKMKLVKGGKR
jgi:PAS domain-containing protein